MIVFMYVSNKDKNKKVNMKENDRLANKRINTVIKCKVYD